MVSSGAGRCLCQAILLWKDGGPGITFRPQAEV
jgi:hypothetical protein